METRYYVEHTHRQGVTMSVRLTIIYLSVLVTCDAIAVTRDRSESATPGSNGLGDTRPGVNGQLEIAAERPNVTAFDYFNKKEPAESRDELTPAQVNYFDFKINSRNSQKIAQDEMLRRRRETCPPSSSQVTRLDVAMKILEFDNTQLKSTVQELQGMTEKLAMKLEEMEKKSNSAISEIAAANQQQQLSIGQLQLQVSQLSTNMMKLQDEREALQAQLSSSRSDSDARHEQTQSQLLKMSNLMSELKSGNNSIYTQLETLTANFTDGQTEGESKHSDLLEKIGVLETQTGHLDAHLSELSQLTQELLVANSSLHLSNAALEERLQSQLSQLQTRVHDLASKDSAGAIGFHARLSHSINTPVDEGLVVDKVEYNSGGGYDPATGVFTAPVTGLYLFLANVAADASGKVAWIRIVHHNTELCKAWSRYSSEIELASCHAATRVVKGQEVQIFTFGQDNGRIRGREWTTFTGVLIQRED